MEKWMVSFLHTRR